MSVGRVLAALAALAVLGRAGVRYRRGRIGKRKVLAWTLVAAALAAYAAGLFPGLPRAEVVLGGLAGAIGPYAYPLVGIVAFLETGAFLGLLTPGELTVLLGGVVAGRGEVSIVPLIGLVWLCSALGDSTGYLIGRRLGRSFLLRRGERLHLGAERLERVEGFFARRGGTTVVAGRFVGMVRTLAPFVAGSSRMAYRRFLPYSLLGTGLWSAAWCLAGYFSYRSFSRIAEVAGQASGAVGAVIVAVAIGVYAYRRLRRSEERERLRTWLARQEQRAALRPLARGAVWLSRVLGPVGRATAGPGRFLLRRVSPGELGIELTSALSAAAVGLYVFAFYAALLEPAPAYVTPLDQAAGSLVATLPRGPLVAVAEALGPPATAWVAGALVSAGAVLLLVRRRPHEAVALLVGFGLISLSLLLAKAGVDRVRPPLAADPSETSSYPSAHAAYAAAYAALAVAAARKAGGALTPTALLSAGAGLCATLALARVYLGASHLSDVLGGLGLGVGVYALCAAGAIVLGHLTAPAAGGGAPERGGPPPAPATSLRPPGTRS